MPPDASVPSGSAAPTSSSRASVHPNVTLRPGAYLTEAEFAEKYHDDLSRRLSIIKTQLQEDNSAETATLRAQNTALHAQVSDLNTTVTALSAQLAAFLALQQQGEDKDTRSEPTDNDRSRGRPSSPNHGPNHSRDVSSEEPRPPSPSSSVHSQNFDKRAFEAVKPLLQDVPKFDGSGGATVLELFIQKFQDYHDLAVDAGLSEKILMVHAAQKLTGSAGNLYLHNARTYAVDAPERWRSWIQLRTALQQRFYPAQHIERAETRLMRFEYPRYNSVHAFNDAFTNLLLTIPDAQERRWITAYKAALPKEIKGKIDALPNQHHDSLKDLQDLAVRIAETTPWPRKHQANNNNVGNTNNNHGKKNQSNTNAKSGNAVKNDHDPKTHYKTRDGKLIPWAEIVCGSCKGKGHLQSQCRKKNDQKRDEKQANQVSTKDQSTADQGSTKDSESVGLMAGTNFSTNTISNKESRRQPAYLDSGCTDHMSPDISRFSFLDTSRTTTLYTADGRDHGSRTAGTGTMRILSSLNVPLDFHNSLYVPHLRHTLISIAKTTTRGVKAIFDGKFCLLSFNGRIIAKAIKTHGNLYRLLENDDDPTEDSDENRSPTAMTVKSTSDPMVWHRRLAHLNTNYLQKLPAQVTGMPTVESTVNITCEDCAVAKRTRNPHPPSNTKYKLLELIHTDGIGPMPLAYDDSKYVISFIDHASRYAKSFPVPSKDAHIAQAKFEQYKNLLENVTGKRITIHRSDRGGDYVSGSYVKFLENNGIQQQLTIRETPAQNGVAERFQRTIEERTRAVLLHTKLPVKLWPEIWRAVVKIYNLSPHSAINHRLPIALVNANRVPDVSNLRVLGSYAYSHVLRSDRAHKLSPAGERLVLLGYSETSKGYRLWDPVKDVVVERYDVQIDESCAYDPADYDKRYPTVLDGLEPLDSNEPDESDEYVVERILDHRHDPLEGYEFLIKWKHFPRSSATWEPVVNLNCDEKITAYFTRINQRLPDDLHAIHPATDSLALQCDVADAPATNDPETNDSRSEPPRIHIEPRTYREAISGPHARKWDDSMKRELESLKSNGVLELVTPPRDVNPIGCKWVYKIKLLPDGRIDKFKSRLVAQGFTQRQGRDFDATYSPVASFSSIRLVLAMAADMLWKIHSLDFITAYLNALLDRPIFMKQIPGYVDPDRPNHVYLLRKALYGLKQSARCWNDDLDAALRALGFTPIPGDSCIYVLRKSTGAAQGGEHQHTMQDSSAQRSTTPVNPSADGYPLFAPNSIELFLIVYVDDVVITGPNESTILHYKQVLHERFPLVDQGTLTYVLGIQVLHHSTGIYLLQRHYIETVLRQFNHNSAHAVATPLDPSAIGSIDKRMDQATDDEIKRYGRLIGSLIYLSTRTRPDIATAIGFLARFTANPSEIHWAALKRVLRYLQGTRDLALHFPRRSRDDNDDIPLESRLNAYSDADWGCSLVDRKSITGYLIRFGRSAVDWRSGKQPVIAHSSTESEMIAASECARQLVHIRQIYAGVLGITIDDLPATEIRIDNSGTIDIAKDIRQIGRRSKHIEIRHLYLGECVSTRRLITVSVASADNTADLLTKGLPAPDFERHRADMGVVPAPQRG